MKMNTFEMYSSLENNSSNTVDCDNQKLIVMQVYTVIFRMYIVVQQGRARYGTIWIVI